MVLNVMLVGLMAMTAPESPDHSIVIARSIKSTKSRRVLLPQAYGSVGVALAGLLKDPNQLLAKELGVDPSQRDQITDILKKLSEKRSHLNQTTVDAAGQRDYNKFQLLNRQAAKKAGQDVARILGKERFQRGKQYVYRRYGKQASLQFPMFLKDMGLTDQVLKERENQLKEATDAYQQSLEKGKKSGDRNLFRKARDVYTKRRLQIDRDFWTADLTKKWESVIGRPFAFEKQAP